MYFLAIDEGTSSTRVMLYDSKGRMCYRHQETLSTIYPKSGWVEQDPDEIWEKTCLAIRKVVERVEPKQILACGITNQRETTVIWNKKTHRCLGPAISWQDRRTEALFTNCSHEELQFIQDKTGLIPNAYFSASKLQWLLSHVPEARSLAERGELAFGTIDSYLLWRFTRGAIHATDISNASRTLLFDIERCTWDDDLLALFSIPKSVLPEVLATDAHFGNIHPDIVGTSIPITAMIGDQQSSLVGQACIKAGMMKATYGSGGFLLLNTGLKPIRSPHLLTTIAYKVQGKVSYGLEGSIYHAGTILKWLRNDLKILPEFVDSERYATEVVDNAGVYFLPSFTSLGAPHWITPPGAMITGLTLRSKPQHIVRAALETVVYQTNDIIQCIQEDNHTSLHVLHVDGGMSKNAWFLQWLASTCNIMVKRPKEVETTALGAAMLAAVGCGYFDTLAEIESLWSSGHSFVPDERQSQDCKEAYQGWLHVIEAVKKGMCI